jgi:L-alanine-DL-glutamate epimerase-like enolase superfamily enzyme
MARITAVDAFLMSYVFPDPLRLAFRGGERLILKRDAMFIRVTTESGLRGYAPGPADERAHRIIGGEIGPFLVGQDLRHWRTFRFAGDLARRKVYAAVEIALMDAEARADGRPLSDVAGSRVRDRIKLYGSAGMYMTPQSYAEEAAAIQAMGFLAYKMRPARGPDEDVETVARMREATGPAFGLMVDAHAWWRMGVHSYDFATAASVARQIARFNAAWLEEPLPPDDHDAYEQIARERILPIAAGEHEQDESGFLDLARRHAADVIQMDVCCQGGFAMAHRVAASVRDAGLRFAFHSWGTGLEVLAAAHFGACWPEEIVEWLEYPCYANGGRVGMYPFPLADEILKEPLDVVDGYLRVPDRPGLGIDIDETVADRYPYKPGPWSLFRIDNPPQTIAVTGDHSLKWV